MPSGRRSADPQASVRSLTSQPGWGTYLPPLPRDDRPADAFAALDMLDAAGGAVQGTSAGPSGDVGASSAVGMPAETASLAPLDAYMATMWAAVTTTVPTRRAEPPVPPARGPGAGPAAAPGEWERGVPGDDAPWQADDIEGAAAGVAAAGRATGTCPEPLAPVVASAEGLAGIAPETLPTALAGFTRKLGRYVLPLKPALEAKVVTYAKALRALGDRLEQLPIPRVVEVHDAALHARIEHCGHGVSWYHVAHRAGYDLVQWRWAVLDAAGRVTPARLERHLKALAGEGKVVRHESIPDGLRKAAPKLYLTAAEHAAGAVQMRALNRAAARAGIEIQWLDREAREDAVLGRQFETVGSELVALLRPNLRRGVHLNLLDQKRTRVIPDLLDLEGREWKDFKLHGIGDSVQRSIAKYRYAAPELEFIVLADPQAARRFRGVPLGPDGVTDRLVFQQSIFEYEREARAQLARAPGSPAAAVQQELFLDGIATDLRRLYGSVHARGHVDPAVVAAVQHTRTSILAQLRALKPGQRNVTYVKTHLSGVYAAIYTRFGNASTHPLRAMMLEAGFTAAELDAEMRRRPKTTNDEIERVFRYMASVRMPFDRRHFILVANRLYDGRGKAVWHAAMTRCQHRFDLLMQALGLSAVAVRAASYPPWTRAAVAAAPDPATVLQALAGAEGPTEAARRGSAGPHEAPRPDQASSPVRPPSPRPRRGHAAR